MKLKITKNMTFLKALLAGIYIGFAGAISAQCQDKLVSGVLFATGLIAVILCRADLFTGKVGYLARKETKLSDLLLMLLLNIVGAGLVGLAFRICLGPLDAATKLAYSWGRVAFESVLCGVCVYVAVEGYRQSGQLLSVIIPISAFVIAGGEHCIADAFFFMASDLYAIGGDLKVLLFLLITIAGNALGALMCCWMQRGTTANAATIKL